MNCKILGFDTSSLPSGVCFYRLVAEGIGDEEVDGSLRDRRSTRREGTIGQTIVSVKKMLLVK